MPKRKMNRQNCKRHDICPAYVCPIDPQWHRVRYTKGDPVCILLLCLGKPGGMRVALDAIPSLNPERFHDFCENVMEKHSEIKKRFQTVANSPLWYMEKQLKEDKEWAKDKPGAPIKLKEH